MNIWILRVTKKDEPGIIFQIARALVEINANIIENDEFVDNENGTFFMRTVFSFSGEREEIENSLKKCSGYSASWTLNVVTDKKIWVFATKEYHCISDILVRTFYKEWKTQVLGVISNHEILREITEKFNVPFFFISHENKSKEKMEEEIRGILDSHGEFDYIVLAKYMRILSPEFTASYRERIINIHHSFLPAFIGAKPYKQAFDRGVKIIGATAHFVTETLDAGPIIAQGVVHVDHTYTEENLALCGRDVEVQVLSSALKLVFEDRVFVNGNKTVIFR